MYCIRQTRAIEYGVGDGGCGGMEQDVRLLAGTQTPVVGVDNGGFHSLLRDGDDSGMHGAKQIRNATIPDHRLKKGVAQSIFFTRQIDLAEAYVDFKHALFRKRACASLVYGDQVIPSGDVLVSIWPLA